MSEISNKQVYELFRTFASDWRLMVHAEGVRCCEARAHVIVKVLQQQGMDAEKRWVWAESSADAPGGKKLSSVTFQGSGGDRTLQYNFHVAAQLNTGHRQALIIDPFLFSGPVTPRQFLGSFEPSGEGDTLMTKVTGISAFHLDHAKAYPDIKWKLLRDWQNDRQARQDLLIAGHTDWVEPKPVPVMSRWLARNRGSITPQSSPMASM